MVQLVGHLGLFIPALRKTHINQIFFLLTNVDSTLL